MKTFLANGYKQMGKDKCVLVKSDVDDCFFVTSRDEEWANMGIKMLE